MSVYIAPSQGGYERWLNEAADEPDTTCSCGSHDHPDQCPHDNNQDD